jgi:NAD(P)-dependent dehydrogenase (short-subunit alcohol dehydrogenase family)
MSKALAGAGADVAMMYVSSDKTHDTAAAVAKEFNVHCQAYKADMINPDEVNATLDQIIKDFGKIDIFVANAGIAIEGPAEVSVSGRNWIHAN